jgi:hypothetical protein
MLLIDRTGEAEANKLVLQITYAGRSGDEGVWQQQLEQG